MREQIIFNQLTTNLGNVPTEDQSGVLKKIAGWLASGQEEIFLLTGFAGTGKTSIISTLVRTLTPLRIKCILLAPTGRAAKVLATYAGIQAFTIHKKIYRQQSLKDGTGKFVLDRNLSRNTVFIVDEASMISNFSNELSIFGSGRLLDDLIEYVYTGQGCRLMLVGDTAQLPPVGSSASPALDPETLKEYGFGVITSELRQVVRQSEESGILMNATRIRLQVDKKSLEYPQIDCENYNDIRRIKGEELLELLSEAYEECGTGGTIVVVNSNRQANRYNQGIRNRIFFREEEISPGDIVMVVKNNYTHLGEDEGPGFIANGDIAEIKRIISYDERYGFRFAEMVLRFIDYDIELESKVMLDVLHSESPSLTAEKSRELFNNILPDYLHLKSRRKQYEAVREDPWFNALQIKFAYAVTCHKAQGGQWERVFIDQGMFNRTEITADYLRWLYTALTRATGRVYLVNFGDEFYRQTVGTI